jgi:hypothetical protein
VKSDSNSDIAFLMADDSDSVKSDVFGDGDWFDNVAMIDSDGSAGFGDWW